MIIAILGGTGPEGAGLAGRWATAGYSIIIGSRDPERARRSAAELRERTKKKAIAGHTNVEAAELGTVIVLALPAPALAATLPQIRERCRDKVVVSTVVPLTFGGPRLFTPPAEGSAAEKVQALLPEARVVAAFHHLAAYALADPEHALDGDLLVCGNDREAKDTVAGLGASVGLRTLDVGPLSNAGPVEGITAILATINRRYKLRASGIRITGF